MRTIALACCLVFASGLFAQDAVLNVLAGYNFAPVGVQPGQTLRINLLNTVRGPLPASILPLSCRVNLRFHDAAGLVAKEETIDNLAPGTIRSVDHQPGPVIAIFPPPRVIVAASVRILAPEPPQRLPTIQFCSVLPSLEVFENASNKTLFVIPGATVAQPFLLGPRPPVPAADAANP